MHLSVSTWRPILILTHPFCLRFLGFRFSGLPFFSYGQEGIKWPKRMNTDPKSSGLSANFNQSIKPLVKLKVPALLCRYVSLYSPPASLETQRTQKIIIFQLPLRGRQLKSTKQLALRKRQKPSILWLQGTNTGILLSEGLSRFAFRRFSEKQKRKTENSAIFAALRWIIYWLDSFNASAPTGQAFTQKSQLPHASDDASVAL